MHKNHNALIITLLSIIVILLFYLAFYKLRTPVENTTVPKNKQTTTSKTKERSVTPPLSFSIPASVRARYAVLADQYANSMGAMISFCEKGTEKLFVASGSSGYTGVEYYYDMTGKAMGSDTFGDVGDQYFIEKRFNLSSYACRVLLISK